MTSLNPVDPVGQQIGEVLRRHRGLSAAQSVREAQRLLDRVGIPDVARRAQSYPHQLSGGMRQRAMIAMAIACAPALLIADEPTTALDVTIQAQILDLLRELRGHADNPLALLFITHNLGIVAEIADRVLVMYAGRIVEEGPVRSIFRHPRHPYTRGLLASIPQAGGAGRDRPALRAIPGQVPSPVALPPGCAFAPRCPLAEARCEAGMPALMPAGDASHRSRCLRWSEI
jgi:peptide/nickel transport system ATP-binding protein